VTQPRGKNARPAETASPLGTLLLFACVVIWGVNAVAYKVGGRAFDPLLLNGLRFLVVAPLITGIVAVWDPRALRLPGRRDLVRYALYGFASVAVSETLMVVAVQHTSVANMTLLGPGTIPLSVALWAVFLREQTLGRAGWLGALLALAGVGIVAASGAHGFRVDRESFTGDAIVLVRTVLHGGYLLLLTRTLRERPILTVTVYNIVFGALWLLPYVAWRAPHVAWNRVPADAYFALAWMILPTTVFGFLAWNWGMRQVGAVQATNVMYLLPVFGAISGYLLLGEPLTPGQAVGGVVVIGGIALLRADALKGAIASSHLPRRSVP